MRLLFAQLGLSYELVEIDILKGEIRTPEFLAMNPNGRIPLLALAPGNYLAESNAILFHLARGTDLLPEDPWLQAQVLQWLFFEQYSHEPYIATSRFWIALLGKAEEYRDDLAKKRAPGYATLGVMERHLARRDWFVHDCYTIADIALYAYTHVAPEGGFELTGFPHILAWLARVRAQPGHIGITQLDD